MGFLADKRILITGVLSKHSIAYGIARACHREGAQLAFTYQSERFKDRLAKFAREFDSTLIYQCDVCEDAEIDNLFAALAEHWDGLDGLVHSIAYAPGEAIEGDFLEGITRDAFRIAHDVSAYSYPALAKAARPLLLRGHHPASARVLLPESRSASHATFAQPGAHLSLPLRWLPAHLFATPRVYCPAALVPLVGATALAVGSTQRNSCRMRCRRRSACCTECQPLVVVAPGSRAGLCISSACAFSRTGSGE